MANLTPLHLDRDTGRIIARGGFFGTEAAEGFLFEQIVPSATWNIPHNGLNDQVLVQVYDEVGELTIPDKVEIVNINNIQITFGSPMGGTAHILFFTSI